MSSYGSIDTVDVSWLHHSQRDNLVRTRSASSVLKDAGSPALSKPSPSTNASVSQTSLHPAAPTTPNSSDESAGPVTPSKKPSVNGKQDATTPLDTPKAPTSRTQQTSKTSSNPKPSSSPRRNSWITNLSAKFSSGAMQPQQNSSPKDKDSASSPRVETSNPFGAAYSPKDLEKKDDREPAPSAAFGSHSPKSPSPSFLHNALRKLSSSGGSSSVGRTPSHGGVCPRRVMNVDPNRDRCKIPELDQAKLRRVAFCVDVEIAGTSRRCFSDDEEGVANLRTETGGQGKSNKKLDAKANYRGEGAALKAAALDISGDNSVDTFARSNVVDQVGLDNVDRKMVGDDKAKSSSSTRKQEKKKKSEEERKERKERKRRQAEASGSVPLQLSLEENSQGSGASTPHRRRDQDQPTTDPVRIYRRCCQLRETGALKKIVELISSPSSILAESPGTVAVLDLSGIWMSVPDIITFSDWLAIVPVRKLILQNCGLTDEMVRIILAGLLSTTSVEQARYKRRSSRNNSNRSSETSDRDEAYGVIEKLSLKDNPKIGNEGWRHIGLFIHMSRSIKGIDLSGIPFPKVAPPTNSPTSLTRPNKFTVDISTTFSRALAERFAGPHLEELVLGECYPSTDDLGKICDAAKSVGLRRFGVANNGLTKDGLEHVVRYFRAGCCEGLDLGGNNISDHLSILSSAIEKGQNLVALSLADCALVPKTACTLLQALTSLTNFRFIDLSHNPALFSTEQNSLASLRRYLPQLPELKRIHLADVSLSSDHAIALAEILPECPKLCHINILENPAIEALAAAKDDAAQEEACALYASLMTAARISRTLVAVDIDVPSPDSNEIIKALASQIVAYSLRNMERGELSLELSSTSSTGGATSAGEQPVPVPDILVHIVGPPDGADLSVVNADEPAPDENYVISGTGVVKALGVCLGNAERGTLDMPGDNSPTASGASTPARRVSRVAVAKKPRDMSKDLLNSARKIRGRVQSALVREDKAGNDLNYRRLQFLDSTLQKTIERFEDAFPETRLPAADPAADNAPSITMASATEFEEKAGDGTVSDGTIISESPPDISAPIDDDEVDRFAVGLSRTSSNTSLHARALTSEEGRVHRFSQQLHRDILDSELDKQKAAEQPTSPEQLSSLRDKLQDILGCEIQSRVETVGPNKAMEELGSSVETLLALQKHDPEGFERFKESQIAAQINAGMRDGQS